MPTNTFKKGDTLYSQDTGESLGIVNYDTQTGAKLREGQTTDLTSNPPTNIIPSDTLSNSTQRLILPPASTDTTGAGLSSYVENMASASQTASDKAITESKKEKDTSGLDYLKALTDSENIPSSIDYTAQDAAKKTSDKLNAQIMADAKATRDRIENVRKNFIGSPAGAQQEIGRIQNESSNHQADLAILKFVADNDYQGAADIADRQLKNKLEASRIKLDALKFVYEENKEMFNKTEDRAYAEKIRNDERAYDERIKTETAISNIKMGIAQYAGTKSSDLMKQLNAIDTSKPDALSKALEVGGKYLTDPLDRQIKQANLAKLNIEIGSGQPIDVSTILDNPSLSSADKNNLVLEKLTSSNKISATNKTQIGYVLGVMSSTKSLAEDNPEGSFTGINPFSALLNVKIPFTDVGIPFRQALKQNKTLQNETYINGIKLQTGYWASGATLTAQQLELVDKMTPNVTDTDDNVKVKLNALTNFMLDQTRAKLLSEGIDFKPTKVDLFEPIIGQEKTYIDSIKDALNSSQSQYLKAGYEIN